MKRNTLSILGCPNCRANLTFAGQDLGDITSGKLTCPYCQKNYPIVDGTQHFIETQTLSRFNRQFSRWKGWLYCIEFRRAKAGKIEV